MASWTAIRVSADTKQQLELLREQWIANSHNQAEPLGSPSVRSAGESKRDEIGLDQVVRRLLLEHQDHLDRSRRKSKRSI